MEPRKQHIKTEYLQAIRQTIAQWINLNMDKTALVSVTRCMLSDQGGSITVFVSVFPTERLSGALSYLRRHAGELAHTLRKTYPHRRTLFLNFEADVAAPNETPLSQE